MEDITKTIEERIEDIGEACNKCGNSGRYVVEMNVHGWPVDIFLSTCNMYAKKWPDVMIHAQKNYNYLLIGPLTCEHTQRNYNG